MPSERRVRVLLVAVGLVLAVLALYWPVHAHGFVSYDDEAYLTQNPHVRRGLDWAEIRWLFTHEHAANYHPLTWVSHMLDVELFGLEPGPQHLVSAALHALNAVLVLFLGLALLESLAAAGAAAALFALHPLRVESVAWASERKDVLCATFFLAALLLYLRYARAPSAARYALVLLATLLALLAKPMAVSLPFVLVLLDLWPLRRLAAERPWRAVRPPGARLWLEKAPFLVLALLGALSTWLAQEVGGAASGLQAVPFELRAWNALATYGTYLLQTLWPARLACFYPLAALVEPEPRAALIPPALASAAVVIGVSVLAWRARTRWPWFLVGWCWYSGLLVPVIGLKQVGMQAHADRYTYLPLIGIGWMLAGLALELARRRPSLCWPIRIVTVVALALCAWRTQAQVPVWRDTPSLFEHALAVTDKNYVAHAALGTYALEDGRPEEARVHLEQALQLYALDATALTSLARIELAAGNAPEAERLLQRAKQVHASKWVRYHMGRVKLALGNQEAAAREFAAALALDPSLVDAHFNLGQVLYNLGRKQEARASFEQALALDPRHAGAHNGLGVLALDAADLAQALEHCTRAAELDASYADAVHNLGVALERLGRMDEARQRFEEERRLRKGRP